MKISFNEPYFDEKILENIKSAFIDYRQVSGNGYFTQKCNDFLQKYLKVPSVFLTNSCTSALEMAAILAEIKQGDEIIMPSYTFVSTANAFVLRGGVPVFVDINPKTLCIDENLIEQAITNKTKAIVVVHYAGISCDMDKIKDIAKKHKLIFIEDAAQAISSMYKNQFLGTIGDIGALSFHETKNISSGEGGAIILNNEKYTERAEIIRDKGTNRKQFNLGTVDKYSWVDIGSSFLPSDIIAAYLYSQLASIGEINNKRLDDWEKYKNAFENFEKKDIIRLPYVPDYITQYNGHIFYLIFNSKEIRDNFINYMKDFSVLCVFHYIPLHSSKAGKKYGRISGEMKNTDNISDTLVRLPLFFGLTKENQNFVIEKTINFLDKI